MIFNLVVQFPIHYIYSKVLYFIKNLISISFLRKMTNEAINNKTSENNKMPNPSRGKIVDKLNRAYSVLLKPQGKIIIKAL